MSNAARALGTNAILDFGFWARSTPVATQMAGSRGLRRKRPDNDAFATNTYWFPFSLLPVRALMALLVEAGRRQAVLYGEVFGRSVQSYDFTIWRKPSPPCPLSQLGRGGGAQRRG